MQNSARRLQRLLRTASIGSRVWLATYAGVSFLAPLGDAALAVRSATNGASHVESADRPACPPSHDHAACQVCRTLRMPSSPSSKLRLASRLVTAIHAASRAPLAYYATTLSGPFGPRAPPQS